MNEIENLSLRGIEQLYGKNALAKFQASTIMVVGLGGVGSWAVESLCRSGVGCIVLIDFDEVCSSNLNRQLCATLDNIGKKKSLALKERMSLIQPLCRIEIVDQFLSAQNIEAIFSQFQPDYVIDAIDSVSDKCHLIHHCFSHQIPIIVTGGAAGKIDPTEIRLCDLGLATYDQLLMHVRKKLRRDFAYHKAQGSLKAKAKKLHIPCVYSQEIPQSKLENNSCEQVIDLDLGLDLSIAGSKLCENKYGSVTHVTATFGLFAASAALKHLSQLA